MNRLVNLVKGVIDITTIDDESYDRNHNRPPGRIVCPHNPVAIESEEENLTDGHKNASKEQIRRSQKIIGFQISDFKQHEKHEVGVYEYTLENLLGEGVFGRAYLAHHINDLSPAVIRVVQYDNLEQQEDIKALFKRDKEIVMKLQRHKNIIKYMHDEEKDGHLYFVMEYCKNKSLDVFMKEHTPNQTTRLVIMKQCAEVLSYLHKQTPCIIHRSIQPAVVLLKGDALNPIVKLIDFQYAEYGNRAEDMCGKDPYMAPEMFAQEPYNEKVDVFSLGCVFLALINFGNTDSTDLKPFPETSSAIQENTRALGLLLLSNKKTVSIFSSSSSMDGSDTWSVVKETTSLMLSKDPTFRCSAEEVVQRLTTADSPSSLPLPDVTVVDTKL